MPFNITRREFLQYSAAVLAGLWLAPLLPRAAGSAVAAPARQESAPAPAFEPLPLPMLLGVPTDVAIGTDGVFWILGESGAPSAYDPQQGTWQPFGGGIDAAAYIPFVDSNMNFSVALCFFRGAEVYKSGAPAPVPIASLWPNLPPSFQQGVDGATYLNDRVGNSFYLFRHGQAAAVDVFGSVEVYPLTDFGGAGWPGGAWQDGRFDYVISGKDAANPGYAIFVRSGEYIVVDLAQGLITAAPQPLSTQFGGAVLALMQQGGIQAGLFAGAVLATTTPLQLFAGPVVYALENATSTAPATAQYLGQAMSGWPASWHPVLRQAPAGSSGALWSVTGGVPITNDSIGWRPVPLVNNVPVLAVDSGADGSVFAVTTDALYQIDENGYWAQEGSASFALQGISVGDAGHVWVTDVQGTVYRYLGGAFTPVQLGVVASDVAANPDGTVWHCSAGNPNAYRYISEGQVPSEAIPIGLGVTSVQKSAGSSFGKAFFLAEQNGQAALLRYTSPYAFKTSNSYWSAGVATVAVGKAAVFLFVGTPPDSHSIVALDAQTGVERWSFIYPAAESDTIHFAPVYDPALGMVYVSMAAGIVTALDAQTGSEVWSLQLDSIISAQPVLASGMIYVPGAVNPNYHPDVQQVYMIAIDAADAARRAPTPVTAWETMLVPGGSSPVLAPPVYLQGNVYCVAWSTYNIVTGLLSLYKLDAHTGEIQWNGLPSYLSQTTPQALVAPAILSAGGSQLLLVNIGQGVMGFETQAGRNVATYIIPNSSTGVTIDSELVVYDQVAYFSDSAGVLYGLDINLSPVENFPSPVANNSILSRLRIMPDTQGQAVVIFGDPSTDNLNFYSTATGNTAALSTNQTSVMVMSPVTADGLIYVGGLNKNTPDNSLGQIFAIRANDVSGLRDFVIESQLLQDYDPGYQPIARYQTHITVVDDAKTPQPFASVKIWADAALAVQIDGQPYNIDPDTPVATTVDATGSLTIISGATDLFATPLRIWATFMDPFERILIYPDREFHGRLPAMIADPNNDDPTAINLATGTNYAGTQVFTDQQQAQATASAVATTCQAAGIAGGTGSGTAGYNGVGAGASLPPYVAYNDLPGMQYMPYNTPAGRQAVPQSPYGLSWSSDTPATYSVLPFAAAAAAADALTGEADSTLPAPIGSGLGSIFSDLWHKIKSGLAKVAKVIVSIGNAVYTGIQYVENGVTKVFRFVVRQIEDLAATVCAFFVALGKAINDIIELLSLLLHFEEVVKTHKILKAAILQQINGLFLTSTTVIQPAIKAFFANGEDKIEQAFCTVKQQIVPGYTCGAAGAGASPPVSGLSGIGATAHTIFRATPKAGGSSKSHAVASTWGFDKVRSHYKQATTPSAALGAAGTTGVAVPESNPILDFANSFANSLTTNTTLQQAYTATLNDFAASFAFKSSTEFLQMALFDLLDVIQDLLISSLAIGEALLEGLLALAGDLVIFLIDPQQGILVQPLDIPIISDLYSALFGSELTFLDLIVLVASIPVTFLYRIVEGQWLSEQVSGQVSGQASLQPLTTAQASLTPIARALGLLNATFVFGRGILMPINDATGEPGAPNPITSYSLAAISTGFFATSMLKAARGSDGVMAATALGLIFAPYIPTAAPAAASFLALVRIGAFIFDMAAKPSGDALFALSGNVLGSLPALAQPLKYLNDATDYISLVILTFLEVIGNFGAGMVDVLNTWINWDAVPTALPPTEEPIPNWSTRLHLPFVQRGP